MKIINSFSYAFSGLKELLSTQCNARIHLLCTILVVLLAVILKISSIEWCLLLLAIALVWTTEALNTSLEFLCNIVSPDFHPTVKKCKDIAAAAVLITAFISLIVGLLIFIPRLN
jgi:diacylglycerol kinase (ATP)